jgi:hypothetical protein
MYLKLRCEHLHRNEGKFLISITAYLSGFRKLQTSSNMNWDYMKKKSITVPAKVPDIHRNKLIFICYNLKYNRMECLVILIRTGSFRKAFYPKVFNIRKSDAILDVPKQL